MADFRDFFCILLYVGGSGMGGHVLNTSWRQKEDVISCTDTVWHGWGEEFTTQILNILSVVPFGVK